MQFQSQGDPVLFLSNPTGIDHAGRGDIIDTVAELNRLRLRVVQDPEIEARIDAFQLAYRMQVTVPELLDFASDRPTAALIADLKQRGLLDDTLVVWGGEFGRTAYTQSTQGPNGRDHHPRCFTMALAGGGIRGGITHGATDDFGYNVASDPVHVRDLHATMLHCLGIDHARFTVRFQGLDDRLTGVESARVVSEILA